MQIVDWVQAASAIGTVAVAIVGWAAARAARDASRAGNRQADLAQAEVALAQEAAKSASAAAKEATRARVDTRAPVLLVVVSPPSSDPLVLHETTVHKYLSEEAAQASRSLVRVERNLIDKMQVWFHGKGFVVNEGNVTALVNSPDEVEFSPVDDFQTEYLGMPVVPARAIETDGDRWSIVPARSVVRFRWAVGQDTASWVSVTGKQKSARLSIMINSRSVGDIGVVDRFRTEFDGSPLMQDQRSGDWTAPSDWPSCIEVVAHTPRRSYGQY